MTDECDCRDCCGEGPADVTKKCAPLPASDGTEPEPTEDLDDPS